MAESRGSDCLIKLFGMTIPVPENGSDAKDLQHSGSGSGSGSGISSIESDVQENAHQHDTSDPSPQQEVVDADDPREEQQQPATAGEEKEKLKKPDKIVPCPRCSSMDTKFCYFNNYNVNQPRHFCKNCQRYWTAGGAMRNVPVGAGRRKNKNAAAAAHFLQRVRAAGAGGCEPLGAANGTVLSFGGHHGAPAAQMDIKEKPAPLIPVGNTSDASVGSSSEGSINRDDDRNCHAAVIKEKATMEGHAANGAAVQHPAAAMNGAAMWPYNCAPSPAYYSSGFAIPVYPAAPGYWGCMVPPGAWSLPWPAVQSPPTPTSQCASSVTSSGPDHSLSLGKHPRDQGDDEGRGRHGGRGKVWAPKTIRIDDADEVARSSIWSLIGIKDDKKDAADTSAHKLGTVFEPKTAKQAMIAGSPFLHANPVAFTRSVTFQEGS